MRSIVSSLVLASLGAFMPLVASAAAYPEVSCSTQKAFESNSCDQCFDGGVLKSGDTLGRLVDTWTNKSSNDQVAFKDEQQMPTIVNIGGSATIWSMNPKDPADFWKFGQNVIWTKAPAASGATAREQFILAPGKNVNFIEADALGATYTLVSTDKKNGELLGMAKFPVVYHDTDSFAKPLAAQTHYECVAFKAAPATVAPTPKPVPTPATKVATGPGEMVLLIAALLLGLLSVMVIKKKSV